MEYLIVFNLSYDTGNTMVGNSQASRKPESISDIRELEQDLREKHQAQGAVITNIIELGAGNQ